MNNEKSSYHVDEFGIYQAPETTDILEPASNQDERPARCPTTSEGDE